MAHIDYYYSVLSPFTYLAGDRLERIAERRDATIAYKPVDMMALFPRVGGLPVPRRHPSRQTYRLQELKRLPRKAGLKLNLHPAHYPTDATPATAAILAADARGGGDVGAVSRAILRACWAEEKDIADPAVVAAALAEGGFDAVALEEALADARGRIPALTDEAYERGVFGAPTYAVGEELFWGQDRLEDLDIHLGEIA